MKILIVGTDYNSQGDLKTQGQYLRDLFVLNGLNATIASRYRNYFLRIVDTVFQILRLKKNDIIIVQVYSTLSIYLELLAVGLGKLSKIKVISTLHGGNIPTIYNTNSFKRYLLTKIIEQSNTVTVPSKFIAVNISLAKNKHVLIRNYVNLNHYRNNPKPQDMIRMFWMRSYHPAYDPFKAIKILEYILNQNISAKLIMAGKDFGYLKETKRYIESINRANDIEVLNIIDNEAKNNIASQSNVYLCTNKIDNAPVSFIEMMAMGLPIVSTNAGGIPYYVEHNKQVILSKDNTVEDMANLIINLHKNPTLNRNLIANGLGFIKEYSSETVFQNWTKLINNVPK